MSRREPAASRPRARAGSGRPSPEAGAGAGAGRRGRCRRSSPRVKGCGGAGGPRAAVRRGP
eukprot:9320744-Pyramimonas_sp.AAC.1